METSVVPIRLQWACYPSLAERHKIPFPCHAELARHMHPGGFDHHVGHLQALRMMSQSSHALVLRCVSAFALHRETHGVADAMIGAPLPLSLPLSSRALLTQNESVAPVAAV